jgi:hypothetical protein
MCSNLLSAVYMGCAQWVDWTETDHICTFIAHALRGVGGGLGQESSTNAHYHLLCQKQYFLCSVPNITVYKPK